MSAARRADDRRLHAPVRDVRPGLTSRLRDRFRETEHRRQFGFDRQHRQELAAAETNDRRTRELRLANALGSGLMEPEVYRIAMERIRQEPVEAGLPPAPRTQTPWPVEIGSSVWDLHTRLELGEQRNLAQLIFAEVVISDQGIERYVLREGAVEPVAA